MEAYKQVRDAIIFQAFREEGFPSHYEENRTPANFNKEAILIVCFFLLPIFGIILILPGFRGKHQFFIFTRTILSFGIGFLIIWCNFEYSWKEAEADIFTDFKVGSTEALEGKINIKLGLRGFNVSFVEAGNTDRPLSQRIFYNEHFSWEWNQGRSGYGPHAGKLQNEFRNAKERGLPLPILKVAEYFTIDGEGFRIGRYHRMGGWYTHHILWAAFASWIFSNILFHMIIQYGAFLLFITGKLLIIASILYCNIQSYMPLEIPFESSNQNSLTWLRPCYSWCLYLNLANGFVCIILALIAVYMDLRYPDEAAQFFGIDVLQAYEDVYTEVEVKPGNNNSNGAVDVSTTTYVALRKRAPISSRLSRMSRMERMSMKKAPNASMQTKLANIHEASTSNGKQLTSDVVLDVPMLRKKIHPDAPVYENFVRDSRVIPEEDSNI